MHSSRMRTACAFILCWNLLPRGVYLPGPWGCTCLVLGGVPAWSWGVYLPGLGGVPGPGVPAWSGGVPAWSWGCTWSGGVYLPGLGGVPGLGGTCLVQGVYLPGLGGAPGLGGCTCLVCGVYLVRYSPLWTE